METLTQDTTEYEQRLRALRHEMTARIHAIDADVHHRHAPVEKDSAEQVTQRENDDVLQALDQEARQVVQQIDRALQRIRDDVYGICSLCGQPIDPERLRALPYVTRCMNCADQSA